MTPDTYLLLGRLEGKLDMVLTGMVEIRDSHEELVQRVSVIEKFNAKLIGIVVAISAVFTGALELGFKAYSSMKGAA